MNLKTLLLMLFAPFFAARMSVVDGADGGGDRGDEVVATDEDEDDKPAPKDEADDAEDDKAKKGADEDEDEDAEEEAEKPAKPKIRIPKERLDQEIQKRRAAEQRAAERIAELEREVAARASTADVAKLERDIAKLDGEYDDAIADGDKAKAKEIKANLRLLERQLTRAESRADAAMAKTAAVSELKYDMALSAIELEHPRVNPDSDEFDKDVAAEVAELIDAFKQKGMDPTAALRKAIKYVLGDPKPADNRDVEKNGLREARAMEARKKAAAAADRTPANLAKNGKDSDTAGGGTPSAKHIARMSQDEFAKLDDAAKAKLRGDDI
jgi:hypothetical protein